MMTISSDQARALAALIHLMRPEWDIPGISKALFEAKDRGDAFELTHAALYAAGDLSNRTPAIIALAGMHWTRGRVMGDNPIHYARCPEIGHTSFPADNCGLCKHDDLDYVPHDNVPDPDREAVYTRGARAARAALAGAPTTDARRLAAGDGDE
jgi:hypothetical protein